MGIGNITFDAAASTAGGATNPLTWNHACAGENRCLVVAVGTNGNPATEVTYNGVAMSKEASAQENTTGHRISLWRLVAPSTGSNQVYVSLSAAGAYSCRSLSFNEVHQTSPNGNSQVTSAAAATSISLAMSSTAGDVVVDAIVWNQAASPSTESAGLQQTVRGGAAGGNFVRVAMSTESGSATATMSWGMTSATNIVYAGLSLRPISIGNMSSLAMMGCGR